MTAAAPAQVELPIAGMTCASCANAVARALQRVPGVSAARVNFAADQAVVAFDPQHATPADLVSAVRQAGYDVPVAHVELVVTGMTCASCERAVVRAAERMPGVVAAQASFASERISLDYVPSVASLSEVIAAVRRAGYDVPAAGAAADVGLEDAEQAARQAELADKRRRMIVGLVLAVPTFVLSMSRDLGLLGPDFMAAAHGAHGGLPYVITNFILFALALPVQLYTGWSYYARGWAAIRNGAANMDVLVALGSTTAFVWSAVVMLGLVSGHVYFETSALILALISVGKYLEARAKRRAGDAIRRLLALAPPMAHVLRDGAEVDVPAAQLVVGDVFIVRAGERAPADGVVVGGRAMVDESMVTGESIPRARQTGDVLIGGALEADN